MTINSIYTKPDSEGLPIIILDIGGYGYVEAWETCLGWELEQTRYTTLPHDAVRYDGAVEDEWQEFVDTIIDNECRDDYA